jgi:hypothetical protein
MLPEPLLPPQLATPSNTAAAALTTMEFFTPFPSRCAGIPDTPAIPAHNY